MTPQPSDTIHRYTCPLCKCMCGLDIHVSKQSDEPTARRVDRHPVREFVDVLSGNAAVNGVPVEVAPA